MRPFLHATLGLAALLLIAGSAGAARPAVEDLLLGVPPAVEGLAHDLAGQGQAAVGDAAGAAGGAVQDGAVATQQVVTTAADTANAQAEAARAAALALADQAYHAPDDAIAEAQRKYDDAELAPRLVGDYLQRRVGDVPELTTPWLVGFAGTYLPFIDALGSGLVVTVGVSGPIGEVPAVILEVADPATTLPDPVQLVPGTQAYLEGGAEVSGQWADRAAQDTLETADALVLLLTR